MQRLLHNIFQIGITSEHSTYEKKIRVFFNQITFFGSIFMFSQAIIFSFIDPILSLIQFIGPLGCMLGLWLHKKVNFTVARLVGFSLVMISGGISAAFIGQENSFHLVSLTVIVANVICFSKKDLLPSLVVTILGIIAIIVTELDFFNQHYTNLPNPNIFRAITIAGMLGFLLFELYFISGLSEDSENIADAKLEKVKNTVRAQNEGITLMMKEIHHRVKNNFQIIISMLNQKANYLEDEELIELFDSTKERINSMSLLHQKIYQTHNIARFNLQEYLETLTESLLETYDSIREIEMIVESDIEEIPNDFIVSFALILNELITNSIKHAFTDGRSAKITIQATKTDSMYNLYYADNGVWKNPKDPKSFGMDLIRLLTEQFSGEMKVKHSDEGTSYDFRF